MNALRAAIVSSLAFATACAPSAFNGLSGGKEEGINPFTNGPRTDDETLAPPRPISPISVSWVNTARPRFRWASTPGLTGAIVELSRTRDFAKVDHAFDGTGTELTAPEGPEHALESGIWFWRLRGKAGEVTGKPSTVVWEVLVRGNAPEGSSPAPTGSILDTNGDGLPDLSVNIVERKEEGSAETLPGNLILLAQPSGQYVLGGEKTATFLPLGHAAAIVRGGIDIDGDGFGDLVVADRWSYPGEPDDAFVLVSHGGPLGFDDEKDRENGYVSLPFFSLQPTVEASGDVNGDGYGDLSASIGNVSLSALGSAKGARTMMVLDQEDPKNALASFAPATDLDGDGVSDVALSSTDPASPMRYALGSPDRFEPRPLSFGGALKAPRRATALTAGDFDGNGTNEIAFATVVDEKPAVCVYAAGAAPLNERSCWVGTGAIEGFGLSLAAGDVDGDGRDDILVASTGGITVLTHQGSGFTNEGTAFTPLPIAGAFLPLVTVIHPGLSLPENRHEKARWAAISADAKVLTIFKGAEVTQTIDIAADKYIVNFGSSLR